MEFGFEFVRMLLKTGVYSDLSLKKGYLSELLQAAVSRRNLTPLLAESRLPALILAGLTAFGLGSLLLVQTRFRLRSRKMLLSVGLLIVALTVFAQAGLLVSQGKMWADGSILIGNPYAQSTISPEEYMPDMMMSGPGATSSVYMTISNSSLQPDQLLNVTCDAADSVEFHQTMVVKDMASMQPLDKIDIPANTNLELKPGSYHLMLTQLTRDLVPNQSIILTLTFKSGAVLSIPVPIVAP